MADDKKSTRRPFQYVADNGYFCDCDTLHAMEQLLLANMLHTDDANQLLGQFYTEAGHEQATEMLSKFR